MLLVLVLVLMLMMVFGIYRLGIRGGRRHHGHGDAVGVCVCVCVCVSVSRRMAVIPLRDCSRTGGLRKLHLSGDGVLYGSGVVGRWKRWGGKGMRGRVRRVGRRGTRCRGRVCWDGASAIRRERMSSEEVLQDGEVG